MPIPLTDKIRPSERLIRLGVRHELPWLIYNPFELWRFHAVAKQSDSGVATAMLERFPQARTLVDVGAGTGTYAAEFRRRGLYVAACEYIPLGRLAARMQGVRSVPFDLWREPPADLPLADLAYCFEVAEHVPPELGARLVRFLARYPTVVFTAAQPGQGGLFHFNEQPKSYWIESFQSLGMTHDAGATEALSEAFAAAGVWDFLSRNILVFSR
jgi:SAM-dependent methyltransferase